MPIDFTQWDEPLEPIRFGPEREVPVEPFGAAEWDLFWQAMREPDPEQRGRAALQLVTQAIPTATDEERAMILMSPARVRGLLEHAAGIAIQIRDALVARGKDGAGATQEAAPPPPTAPGASPRSRRSTSPTTPSPRSRARSASTSTSSGRSRSTGRSAPSTP